MRLGQAGRKIRIGVRSPLRGSAVPRICLAILSCGMSIRRRSIGVAAARQGDFERALQLLDESAARGVMPRRLRHDIRLMWNRLRIRVMAGQTVTGTVVRAAWEIIRDESVQDMKWRAAISAAVIVDSVGHHDLADRLARWVRRTYPGDIEPIYAAEFALMGLATAEPAEAYVTIDDIEGLMAEVLAITDNM